MAVNKNILFTVAILFMMVYTGEALKILVLFTHFGKSHFLALHPLLIGLVDKGHELTVLSHFPNNPPVKGYTDLSLEGTLPQIDFSVNVEKYKPFIRRFQTFESLKYRADIACNAAYNSKHVENLMKTDQKFDVIITELFNSDCILGLVHYLKAPHISFSSHTLMPWAHERFGNIDNPAIIPHLFGTYSTEMTFMERLDNFVFVNLFKILYYIYCDIPTDKFLKEKFGSDFPSIAEIKSNTAMILVNLHYSMSGARPQVPAVVDVGGMHIKPAKPLDKELNDFINGAEHGVIYVSWGSQLKAITLPEKKRNDILKAFGSLKQRVIWKWEDENLPGKPNNVLIKKWLPQRDVLAHKNIRAFMTHGGLLGITEAVHCGVPLIVTPHFGDQFVNSAAVRARGMAIELLYDDINTESVVAAINKILQPSFSENSKRVQEAFVNRPMPPLETAIWWVEHVARTGGAQLQSPIRNMPLYQYLLIDVLATLLLGFFLTVYILYKIVKLFCRKQKTKKD